MINILDPSGLLTPNVPSTPICRGLMYKLNYEIGGIHLDSARTNYSINLTNSSPSKSGKVSRADDLFKRKALHSGRNNLIYPLLFL